MGFGIPLMFSDWQNHTKPILGWTCSAWALEALCQRCSLAADWCGSRNKIRGCDMSCHEMVGLLTHCFYMFLSWCLDDSLAFWTPVVEEWPQRDNTLSLEFGHGNIEMLEDGVAVFGSNRPHEIVHLWERFAQQRSKARALGSTLRVLHLWGVRDPAWTKGVMAWSTGWKCQGVLWEAVWTIQILQRPGCRSLQQMPWLDKHWGWCPWVSRVQRNLVR